MEQIDAPQLWSGSKHRGIFYFIEFVHEPFEHCNRFRNGNDETANSHAID